MSELNIANIQHSTKERHDFNGVPIITNYGHWPPYCIVEESGVHGKLIDALQIATHYLNLTLVLQETKPENVNIWDKK